MRPTLQYANQDADSAVDEIIVESNVTPWTDADYDRAAEIGKGLFDGFAEQVRKWRDQDELLDAER